MKRGKNYVSAASAIDKTKQYETLEAMDLVISGSKAKFDETVEAHFRLGVDGRNATNKFVGLLFFHTEQENLLKFW